MSSETESERASLRRWITERSGRVRLEELRDDTPLLETRILTSLHVMDLLLFIQRLSGRPVNVERLRPGAFRDIDSICATFLSAADDTAAAGRR